MGVRNGSTPLLPCPCGHTVNFKKSEVSSTKKCGRPHMKKKPLSAKCPYWSIGQTSTPPPDCGRLLWTALHSIDHLPTNAKNAYGTFKKIIVTSFPVTEGTPFFVNLRGMYFLGKVRLNQGKTIFRFKVI